MSKISTKNLAIAINETTKGKSGHELDVAISNVVDYLIQKRILQKAPDIHKK